MSMTQKYLGPDVQKMQRLYNIHQLMHRLHWQSHSHIYANAYTSRTWYLGHIVLISYGWRNLMANATIAQIYSVFGNMASLQWFCGIICRKEVSLYQFTVTVRVCRVRVKVSVRIRSRFTFSGRVIIGFPKVQWVEFYVKNPTWVKVTVLPLSWISHTATGLLKLHTTETKPNPNPNTWD